MMNLQLLEKRIETSGLKKGEIAKIVGISPNSLSRRLHGRTKFSTKEVNILCKVLRINNLDDKINIFLKYPFQK